MRCNMGRKITLADETEIEKRREELEVFISSVIDPEEAPYFVSDEASVYDITLEDDEEVLKKIKRKYGLSLNHCWLKKPIWQLLDHLKKK